MRHRCIKIAFLCNSRGKPEVDLNPNFPSEEPSATVLTEEDIVIASQTPDNIKRNTPEMQRRNLLTKVNSFYMCCFNAVDNLEKSCKDFFEDCLMIISLINKSVSR